MSREQSSKSFRSLLGIPPSKPTPKDSCLVIVDAQNEYDHGLLAISNVKSSRAVIGDVLRKYRDAGGDVVHVVHDTPQGAPLFSPGTELAEEFKELEGEGEKVIHKRHPSSFTDTDLREHLDKIGKKKVVLAGAELGYDMSVIKDGIGDRDIPGATASQLVDTVCAELGDVSATIIESKDI